MTQAEPRKARIFISYKRDIRPDEAVALRLSEALSRHHEVFIDQKMLVGTRWAERIDEELRRSDFLIPLLSERSVNSEMVEGEIATAHRLAEEQGGRPTILPVRLAYSEPFRYPLSAYLGPINWAFWGGEDDTPRLIDELLMVASGGEMPHGNPADIGQRTSQLTPLTPPLPSAQPMALELPEGTMDSDSAFYMVRSSDAVALATIKRQGETFTIKGPRQMGKSSLLMRTRQAALRSGKRVAYLDFQLFDRSALQNADVFFQQFCSWLSDELELEDRTAGYWSMGLGNSQRCTRYMTRYVLKELNAPLVLAMDEVESIFDTEFRNDFFGMLRSWHNSRHATSAWKQLDLALVTSTEPYQLIGNLNQSPFNVGEVIELTDFTAEQVNELNRRHESPLDANGERQLFDLLGGHPYLVRRALYMLTSGQIGSAELFENPTDDHGPFGDHLRHHLFRLHDKNELMQGLRQILRDSACSDETVVFRLQAAGLVRRAGRSVVPRNRLYAQYFRERI